MHSKSSVHNSHGRRECPRPKMLVATLSFLLSVTLPLYFIGHFFFAAFVLHTPMILPRRLFGLTFAASSSLLLLVLLEIWGKLEADSRLLIWRLHLVGDLVLVVLLLPYLLISLALQHATNCSVSISRWLALVLLAAWLWLFYKIGEPFPIMLAAGTSPDASAMSQGTWDWTAGLTKPWTWDLGVIAALCLSRAGVVGVTVSSVMSGIGAVYGPATSLRRLVQSVDRSMLEEAKRGVLTSVTQLAKHRLRLRAFARRTTALRRRDAEQRLITANAWSDGRWHELSYAGLERFARCALASAQQAVPLYLRSSAYREALRELRATQAEDRSRCAALRRQLIALEQILDDQQRATFAQTRRGRLFNAIGWVFSVYCVYKVVMATRSILKHSGAAAAQGGINSATPAVPSAHSPSSLSSSSSSSSSSSFSTSPSSPATVDGVEMQQELRSLGYSYVVAQLEQLVAYWLNSSHEAFVTRALGVAIRLSLLDETVLAFWSQGVSLVLIGAMTFSSVRSFLVQAARIAVRIEQRSEQRRVERLRRKQMQQQQQRPSPSGSSFPTALSPVVISADPKLAAAASAGVESGSSSGGGAPALADLVGCVAAELLGFYLLSSVLLMRASLPHEFRRGISEAVEMGGAVSSSHQARELLSSGARVTT